MFIIFILKIFKFSVFLRVFEKNMMTNLLNNEVSVNLLELFKNLLKAFQSFYFDISFVSFSMQFLSRGSRLLSEVLSFSNKMIICVSDLFEFVFCLLLVPIVLYIELI